MKKPLELPNLHCHLEPWLDAAAHRQLTAAQRLTLERHLCECPHCMARTQGDKLLDHTMARLSASGHLNDAMQTRFVANFLDAVEQPEEVPAKSAAPRLRLAIALVALVALTIRFMDPGILTAERLPGMWETVHQLFLHNPDYQQIQRTAVIAAEDHLPLAALHKLASAFSATLAWLALFLVGRHSFINLCRRYFTTKRTA